MKRGMIFIDGSNVFHDWQAAKTAAQMDVEKYIDVVKSKFPNTEFVRTYYFMFGSGENDHLEPNENSQFESIKNRQQPTLHGLSIRSE